MLLVSEPVLGAEEKAALTAVIGNGAGQMGDRVRELSKRSLACMKRTTQSRSAPARQRST